MKIITYDDTRNIAIKIIKELIALGHLEDNDDTYFEIQDVIHDEINDLLDLDIDDRFQVQLNKRNK